jgi:uncharacterized membrane protein YbhN (UPF0104 family)
MVLLAMGLVAGLARPDAAPLGVLGLTAGLFAGGLLVAWLLRRSWWARWGSADSTQDEQRADRWGRWARRLHLPALAEAVAPYNRRALSLALAVSLAFNLLQIGWNVALAQGLGLHVPLVNFLIFVPLTAVALLLPAFGGLGVRELTYVGLFGSAGVPQASALALSLGVYLITVATGLVGGVVYLIGGMRRAGRGDGVTGPANSVRGP